jgi:3-phenylpropionate/cinnamic acid dioxygenase small subunit
MPAPTPELQFEIESFLYAEARLLEQNRLTDWLGLFADQFRYWMPVREYVEGADGQATGADTFALFDDDRQSLSLRVARLETGIAHAEVPKSVTQRLVTNVVIAPDDRTTEIRVGSNFMVYQERRGRHAHTFFGRRDDVLMRERGKLRIGARKIELAQTILPTTISIFF